MGKTLENSPSLMDFFKKTKYLKKSGEKQQYPPSDKYLQKSSTTKDIKHDLKRTFEKITKSEYFTETIKNNSSKIIGIKLLDNIGNKDSSNKKIHDRNSNNSISPVKVFENKQNGGRNENKMAEVSTEQLLMNQIENQNAVKTFTFVGTPAQNNKTPLYSATSKIKTVNASSSIILKAPISGPKFTPKIKYIGKPFEVTSGYKLFSPNFNVKNKISDISVAKNGNKDSGFVYTSYHSNTNHCQSVLLTPTNSLASLETESRCIQAEAKCTQTEETELDNSGPFFTSSISLVGSITPQTVDFTKPYQYNENSLNLRNAFIDVCKLILDFYNLCKIWYENMDADEYIIFSQNSYHEHNHGTEINSMPSTETNELFSSAARVDLQWNVLQDSSLLSNDTINLPKSSDAIKDNVLTSIRAIFQGLNQSLEKNEKLVLKVRRMGDWKNTFFEEDRLQLKPKETSTITLIVKNYKGSEHKFCLMIYLLIKIYNLVSSDSMCTKRQLFYDVVSFVKNQDQINVGVDTISCMLGVPQWDLGVLSCSKGLVYGDLKIHWKSNETISFSNKRGTLIPNDLRDIKNIQSQAKFILVVEKEAVFQKLLDEDIYNKFFCKFLLVTGKGYPDISTRLLTRILTCILKIPVFMLADADPYGIDILLTYKYGSLSTCFMSKQLAVPNMRWIGLHPSDMQLLDVKVQPLTATDVKKLKDMLNRPYFAKDSKIKQEIQVLLQKGHKAEIEGLIHSNKYLAKFYLLNKLYTGCFF